MERTINKSVELGLVENVVLSQKEVAAILRKLEISYTSDVLPICCGAGITDPELFEKWFKAAYYEAAKDSRSIITAKDVNVVLAAMRK